MEATKDLLKNLIQTAESQNNVFKRNILKEHLQLLILDFMYSSSKYSELIFYGGSCLKHCFNLQRLSEDLDFVDVKKEIKLSELARDIERYFKEKTDLHLTAAIQKFRIYLKFPILHELKLSEKGGSDFLFLKVEVFNDFTCKEYTTRIIPIFKQNKSILIKTFDLPTLMATKIMAIFHRKWEKRDKKGNILASVKGRDYFDLMWYLQKKIKPNIKCLKGIKDEKMLKEELLTAISKIDTRSIAFDLEALIGDMNFVHNLSGNIKEILKQEIL